MNTYLTIYLVGLVAAYCAFMFIAGKENDSLSDFNTLAAVFFATILWPLIVIVIILKIPYYLGAEFP